MADKSIFSKMHMRFLTCGLIFFIAFLIPMMSKSLAAGNSCPGWRDLKSGTRIVGGKFTDINKWPGLGALRLGAPMGRATLYICGATTIAPDWILTAAHCVDDINRDSDGVYRDSSGRPLEFIGGVSDLYNVETDNIHQISEIHMHGGYVPYQAPNIGNDIALIRLAKPWRGNYLPLSVSKRDDPKTPPGSRTMVAGFGLTTTETDGAYLKRFTRSDGKIFVAGSRKLSETSLPSISQKQCADRYEKRKIGNGQICAGFEQGGRDACQGDSGGPLIVFGSNGCPRQIGIVSWGKGCGVANSYGVYTRVSNFHGWIKKLIPNLSSAGSQIASTQDAVIPQAIFQLQSELASVDGQIRIGVSGGNKVKLHSKVRFEVDSNVTGRLLLLDINSEGDIAQLFPNGFVEKKSGSIAINAGQKLVVPLQSHGFDWFRASEPIGRGYLIAIVVPDNFSADLFGFGPNGKTRDFTPEIAPSRFLMNLVRQIGLSVSTSRTRSRQITGEWALGVATYDIIPE